MFSCNRQLIDNFVCPLVLDSLCTVGLSERVWWKQPPATAGKKKKRINETDETELYSKYAIKPEQEQAL